jgi:hypothetical protein
MRSSLAENGTGALLENPHSPLEELICLVRAVFSDVIYGRLESLVKMDEMCGDKQFYGVAYIPKPVCLC